MPWASCTQCGSDRTSRSSFYDSSCLSCATLCMTSTPITTPSARHLTLTLMVSCTLQCYIAGTECVAYEKVWEGMRRLWKIIHFVKCSERVGNTYRHVEVECNSWSYMPHPCTTLIKSVSCWCGLLSLCLVGLGCFLIKLSTSLIKTLYILSVQILLLNPLHTPSTNSLHCGHSFNLKEQILM